MQRCLKRSEKLTLEQKATNHETWTHIHDVQECMTDILNLLIRRMVYHDQSKLRSPEVEIFTVYTPKLKGTTYGSDEYKQFLKEMGPALDHHYERNEHHPEYHKEGIDGMTLIGLIEMLADWKAATLRHDDGDMMKSLAINKERFGISDQLAKILKNTTQLLWGG